MGTDDPPRSHAALAGRRRLATALMDESGLLPLTEGSAPNPQAKPVGSTRAASGRTTIVTIATPDRAAQSRIFARSARRCYPDARLVVLAINADRTQPLFEDLYDLVISPEELSLGCLADMRFRYSTAELCFALKPWIIKHLLDEFPDEPVYYFDSDIELFTPLAEVETALACGANLVVTPHILQPAPDLASEQTLLRSGSLNAGFLAVAPSAEGRGFVDWWGERLRTGSTLEITCGDQKWLDLASAICDGVAVLRHPGYNFAFWNAHERKLICQGDTWTAAGQPLRFVHYTKWNLRKEDSDQYLAKYFCREYQSFSGLFADYQRKVQGEDRFGVAQPRRIYGEVRTPSGEPIPDLIRGAYARHGPTVDGQSAEVFDRVVAALNAPSIIRADLPELPITVLSDEIWERHADLRYRFNADQIAGRWAYLQWLVHSGAAELGIPAAFVTPVRTALGRERVRQLEAGEEPAVPPASVAAPHLPEPLASADAIAALTAAHDAERDRARRRDDDVRLLAGSNKALRREVQALRVRCWCNEETIPALEAELAQARRARDSAARRSQHLAEEVAALHSGWWYQSAWRRLARDPSADRSGSGRRSMRTETGRQPVLAGDGPFFTRGFHLSDAAAVDGATVKRVKGAPSGTMIFGPYVNLPAGTYAVTVDARLYQRLPIVTSFRLDVVRDDTRQLVGLRKCRLYATRRRQSFALIFTVYDGEDYPDYEVRIWARKGTPLEIGQIELYRLTDDRPQLGTAAGGVGALPPR